MFFRLSIVASGFVLGVIAANAAELPIYEVAGFPITAHQFALLGPANAEQSVSAVTPTMAGMPASPHQLAVLTPRRRSREPVLAGNRQNDVRAGYVPAAVIDSAR